MLLVSTLSMSASSQSLSFSDCQQIADAQARYRCYDEVEETNAGAASNDIEVPSASSTTNSTNIRNRELPVIRRPNAVVTGNSESAESAQDNDVAQQQDTNVSVSPDEQERTPFYKRIWPFGSDDKDGESAGQAVVDNEQDQATDPSELDSFGRPGDARLVENEEGNSELQDTVTAVDLLQRNLIEITLESGQVWRQVESKPYLLAVGDTVRIYPTIWGESYRLTVDRLRSYIQVVRID